MTTPPFTRGLHEVGDGLHAYLQPGGWGYSNAGLITADGTSLLVDTLFDLRLTADMLDAMRPLTDAHPVGTLVNTHGDGDHCWGNQAMTAETTIVATSAAAQGMQELQPSLLVALRDMDLGEDLNAFRARAFEPFHHEGIEVRLPDETYDERTTLTVGDRTVEFIPFGPAHTAGDAIVHVPDAGVAFTGDILFADITPLTWHAPLTDWIDACERLLELDAAVLVPGHGPVSDGSELVDMLRYLRHVDAEARARHAAGMSIVDAADDIELTDFADWSERDRIVANVAAVYRGLDPSIPPIEPAEMFLWMQQYLRRHS